MTHAYILGDSLTGFHTSMCARLGWTHTESAVGGSGYTHRAPTHLADSYSDRLPALLAAEHDVIFVIGGGNDTGEASFAADVQAFYTALRAGRPTEPVYVVPTHRMGQDTFDLLVPIVASAGAVLIDWGGCAEVPRTGTSWLTGTGNVADPQGDGNRDTYMGADNLHPEDPAGRVYIGHRTAYEIGPNRIAGITLQSGVPLALEVPA